MAKPPTDSLNKGSSYLLRLQSVRAIAALMVAFIHSVMTLHVATEHDRFILHVIQNFVYDRGAVFIFFILSGFVLGLTLTKGKAHDWRVGLDFIVRRIFRLFPATFFTSIICLLYNRWFYTQRSFEPLSDLFSGTPPTGLSDFLANIFMFSSSLNPVTWSLQVEWLFSLLLPIVYYFADRSLKANGLVFILLLLIDGFVNWKLFDLTEFTAPWTYLFVCYAGWLMALYRTSLKQAYLRLPRAALYGLITLAFATCLSVQHFSSWFLIFVIAATFLLGVIAFDVAPTLFRPLDQKALISLGNYSYSFYLLHPLVLHIVSGLLLVHFPQDLLATHVWLGATILFTTSVCVTIPASWLGYQLFERPFILPHRKGAANAMAVSVVP